VHVGQATGPHQALTEQGFEAAVFAVKMAALCRVVSVNEGISECLLNKQLTDNSTLEWTIGLLP
jgi:hypothetical protein